MYLMYPVSTSSHQYDESENRHEEVHGYLLCFLLQVQQEN